MTDDDIETPHDRDRDKVKPIGVTHHEDGSKSPIMGTESAVDALKEPIERFQRCPVCQEWCAVAKLKKRELQEEGRPVEFECDNCGEEFLLEDVKEKSGEKQE